MENRGETFLPACWEFITFNFLFVLLAFAFLRWGYKCLRKYRMIETPTPKKPPKAKILIDEAMSIETLFRSYLFSS